MKRRSLLQSIPAVAGLGFLASNRMVTAQDSTPEAPPSDEMVGVPPIRWTLASIDTADDSLIPEDPTQFTIQFLDGGQVGLRADCNVGGGGYILDGESIVIENVFSTMAFCGDESLDQAYLAAIQAATTWSISSDPGDQLSLNLDEDGSAVLFYPALQGVVWQWQEFLGGDGSLITPDAPERYTIEIQDDSSVQVQADCNSGRGDATVNGSQIDLIIGMTKKMCADDSYFNDFARILDEAVEWIIAGGDLYLNLPMDSGGARFKAIPPVMGEEATPAA